MCSFALVAVTVNKLLPVLPLLVEYNANNSILVDEFRNMKVTSITVHRDFEHYVQLYIRN
jgi:hypothetical protein